MSKKIHSIAIVLIGLLFSLAADASADIEQAKQNVLSLVMKGSYAQARTQTNKLVTDFPADPCLQDALYLIARQYELSDRYEGAKEVYQKMLQNTPGDNWAGKANLGIARTDVLFLIMSKSSQAGEAFNKLVADFKDNPDFTDTLYYAGRRYEWADKYEDAKNVYSRMLEDNSDASWTGKAKLSLARATILSLVMSGNYSGAREAFDKLAAENFSGHEDWPDTLYWIAERYQWAGRYEEAKDFYQKVIQDCPGSPYASKAKLGIPRAEVQFLIRYYRFEEAKKALDKMVADFNDHPDLPATLYRCAEKYRLSDNYEEEKALYQRIQEKYPNNKYASKVKLGLARTSVQYLIKSQNYEQAEEAFGKLVADFNGQPDLKDTLCSVARSYGSTNRYEDEKNVYQLIIQRYPDSPSASKAESFISTRSNILFLIASKDYDGAEKALDKMIADFNNHPDLSKSVFIIGEEHYNKALNIINDPNLPEGEANEHFRRAIVVWDKLITQLPPSAAYTPQTYYYIAVCYRRLGQYEKAIEYCQKIVDNWPDCEYMGQVKQTMNSCLKTLGQATSVSEE